jgi:hypothetical protein
MHNFIGIIIGVITFVIIGVFHPLVIKAEYYLGVRSWILFLLAGLGAIVVSVFTANIVVSAALGVLGFSCLWSIKEVFEQEERVREGRYPKNPKRKYKF